MAFFDKLNDLAKNVGEKANDAIETTKLNNKINAEKAAIAEEFRKIGEFYYAKHTAGDEVDAEVEEFISSVDAHKTAIIEAETQIKVLKEEANTSRAAAASTVSIVCPTCGKQNNPGTKFCCECGGKLEVQPQPQSKFCTSCGALVSAGVKFCNECGAKIK